MGYSSYPPQHDRGFRLLQVEADFGPYRRRGLARLALADVPKVIAGHAPTRRGMLFLFQTLCLARDRVGVAVRKATTAYLRALLSDRAERRMGCWRQTTARAFAELRASDRRLSEGNSDLRILLVEDNQPLADWLARTLRKSSYTVDCVHDGAAADHLLHTESYALVILDLSLPKLDGNQVLKRLRARDNNVPVLILTVTNTPEGRITGLDTGADDYVTKPFDVAELEARIRALLRRDSQHRNPMLQCGSLSYDTNSRVFTLNDVVLRLTPHEQAVLEVLIKNMGKTVSKQFLADSIYGINEIVAPDAIEVYVHRLRKKLEPGDASIITLRGLGYLLKQRHGL